VLGTGRPATTLADARQVGGGGCGAGQKATCAGRVGAAFSRLENVDTLTVLKGSPRGAQRDACESQQGALQGVGVRKRDAVGSQQEDGARQGARAAQYGGGEAQQGA